MTDTTDTIGWGDVDSPPRRLPRLRLNRRRRIALAAVAVLVAAGVLAWPSFRSWRADDAARQVQHLWERAQGLDNARVVALSGVQQKAGMLDRLPFARAVSAIDVEEATVLDRLARQAKGIRAWTSDVAAARGAVVRAMTAQAEALRSQATKTGAITVDLPVITGIDDQAVATADVASTRVDALAKKHHLETFAPTTERFHSASTVLAQLNRPTDEPLHLQLVSTGIDGVTVTDLDTGRVAVRRSLDTTDPEGWQPERLFGHSLVGSVDGGTLIIPLSPRGRERLISDTGIASSVGSPMWLLRIDSPALEAVDESGRSVGRAVPSPAGLNPTSMGTGSLLLLTNPDGGFFHSTFVPEFYLVRPGSGHSIKLPARGCAETAAFEGGLVVVSTGASCDYSNETELFDTSGRLVRTVKLPAGNVTNTFPITAPDGRHVAFVTAPTPTEPDIVLPTQVRILDTATGSWTTVDGSDGWQPLNWSSDGTTLLLQVADGNGFNPTQQFGALAYLRVGSSTLHSIRVAADLTNSLS